MNPDALNRLWEEHIRHEFATHDTEETLATMVDDAYVNHIPTLTGGVGKRELRDFYSKRFIPQMPPDTEMTPISRTIGTDQLVDEMVLKFTHTIRMDWMVPGVPPTGKRVEVPLGRDRALPRREARPRTHLLGSGVRPGATGIDRRHHPARRRSGKRPQSPQPTAALQRSDAPEVSHGVILTACPGPKMKLPLGLVAAYHPRVLVRLNTTTI
jgi:hypothetical protein